MEDYSTLDTNEYMMVWHLNNLCNFRCTYCFGSEETLSKEHPETGRFPPAHITKCFDDTGKNWRIHLSGGETFLYPKFVELAEALTHKHYISVNTNLSTSNIYEFADVIPPEKVISINAGLHILEREQKKHGLSKYLEALLYFQEKGFTIRLEYVTYPPLLSRFLDDIEYFKSQGVKNFNLKIFRGTYKKKFYPQSYTDEERRLLRNCLLDSRELDILQNEYNFQGMYCSAGRKFFKMDISGKLTRCSTLKKEYGNFFTGNYSFDTSIRPCPASRCACPYEGLRLIQDQQKAFRLLTFKERIVEKYFRSPYRQKILQFFENQKR